MINAQSVCTVVSIASIFLSAVVAAQSILPLPDSATTNVSLRSQEETNWCWAASGQMIMARLGKPVEQCLEAKNRFTLACCDTSRPANCDQGGWPEFDKYGFSAKTTNNSPLTWDQLR